MCRKETQVQPADRRDVVCNLIKGIKMLTPREAMSPKKPQIGTQKNQMLGYLIHFSKQR